MHQKADIQLYLPFIDDYLSCKIRTLMLFHIRIRITSCSRIAGVICADLDFHILCCNIHSHCQNSDFLMAVSIQRENNP